MKTLFFALLCISSPLSAWYQTFSIGGHFNYTKGDYDNTPDVKGYQSGVALSYELEHDCYFGEVAYEGYWTSVDAIGGPSARSSLREQLVELRLGRRFQVCNCVSLKPYLGVGYDRYDNDVQPSSTSLHWRFKKTFIPVGILAEIPVRDNITVGGRLEFRPDVSSEVEIGSNDIESKLKCKSALRLEVPVTMFLGPCQCYNLQLIPFADWSRWGKSKETNSLGIPLPIPSQKRRIAGLRVLFGIQF